jgi:prepilin-type N-terminal cleavage/methylation domain-containing protein
VKFQYSSTPALHSPAPTRRGFTLIEVIIVVVMIAVLTAMAAFSFAGFGDDLSVKGPSDELIRLSKTAVRAAAIQGRPFTIAFGESDFALLGWEGKGGNQVALPEGTKLSIMRWGQKEWQPAEGQSWLFGANGLCDPIRVRFESGEATLEMAFNPLTGSPTDQLMATVGK